MSDKRTKQIFKIFENILEDIANIKNSNFYYNKCSLEKISQLINSWYNEFKRDNTLKKIKVDDLIFVDEEITELFDMYVKTESVTNNFTERLLYDFSVFKRLWKDEMLQGR